MPEGDTIRRLADRLDAAAAGMSVRRSVFRHNRWATTDLAGLTLARVDAAGKHLLMRLHRADHHVATIHSHLRMHGSWTVGVPPRVPAWRRRVELHLEDGPILCGVNLPVLDVGRPADEARWVGHLGPDLCAARFDLDRAAANVRAAGAEPLGGALLDQRNLAGIGNLYAVEIPFLCAVSPWQPAGTIEHLDQLVAVARALLPVNAAWGPMSTTGLVGRGREHWIYGRRGQACPLCRTPLQVAEEHAVPWGRVTTWCPGCQADGGGPDGTAVVDVRRALRLLRRHGAAVRRLRGLLASPPAADQVRR